MSEGFKTHDELRKHLADGGAVRLDCWDESMYLALGEDGELVNEKCVEVDVDFEMWPACRWLPWVNTKKSRVIQVFETQADIWIFLIGGGKIARKTWGCGSYIHLVDGFIRNESGGVERRAFYHPKDWVVYSTERSAREA